jgi:hypothetical protein
MNAVVPKQFHFVYGLRPQDRPFPLMHYLCLESCARVNQPDRIFFHCHHEPYGVYWDRIRPRLEIRPVELNARVRDYRYPDPKLSRYRYAHLSDFIRLDALIEQGGVYADIDSLFVNPLPERLYAQPCVLGREGDVVDAPGRPARPSLCNALIMAAPQSDFLLHWRSELDGAFDGSWSNHSTALPWQLSCRYPDLIHIEPVRSFYKYLWTREDLHRLLEGAEDQEPDVFSIHLWAHLWESRGRRDFSDFHSALVSERRIRRVDSTYNRIALRHLPPPSLLRSARQAAAWWLAALRLSLRRKGAAPGGASAV